jgi:hypothetical protein
VRATNDPAAVLSEIEPLLDRTLTLEQVRDRLSYPDVAAIRRRVGRDVIPGGLKVGKEWRILAAPFTAWQRGWWTPDTDGDFDAWLTALRLAVASS